MPLSESRCTERSLLARVLSQVRIGRCLSSPHLTSPATSKTRLVVRVPFTIALRQPSSCEVVPCPSRELACMPRFLRTHLFTSVILERRLKRVIIARDLSNRLVCSTPLAESY